MYPSFKKDFANKQEVKHFFFQKFLMKFAAPPGNFQAVRAEDFPIFF